ncbi:tyrosine-type recombinase/integrase [Paracoccus yeei]|uniref:Tyrosine-type recombinase/integrase n=1 Tax=Paracoccus yeei TaxID=147645 RepID=A0A5P2QUK6_9RHOB|nr:tyrosine-type recombinase/integrase [Paracoccus yeei]QEU09781.1 tyrosine-type recombinase/integrase [Paracoccus yeei]
MAFIRVRGFKIFKDRHGRSRCYHRATGHKIDLKRCPLGSAEFFAECEKVSALALAMKAKQPKAGTLGALVAYYLNHEHFRSRSERTRADYQKQVKFLAPILDVPVPEIDTPLIVAIHDKASQKRGWRQANMLRTLLSEVFRFCKPAGLIEENYAKAVIAKPRPANRPRANRPWEIEELLFVLANAPPQIAAAVALMANTGLDPSDALRLRCDAVVDGVIWVGRGKTGEPVAIPVPERLQAALECAPKHDAITLLASTMGEPWTYNGFSTVWDRWKRQQAKDGHLSGDLTLKGLRHTMATVLREAGADLRQIADLLGQKTESMASWYSRDAQLSARNGEAMRVYDNEIERRTKTVKPKPKSV